MDARVGVSTYHNVATSAGDGLRTAADLGIPGANLDEFTSGMTRIEVQNGWSNPIAGYSPSLPWNRGETTPTAAVTVTKLWGNHTVKFGGDYRHNEDYLLQTQDQGGPRGRYQFGASQTASTTNTASQTGITNLVRGVPARSAQQRQSATSRSSRSPACSTRRRFRPFTTSGRSVRR